MSTAPPKVEAVGLQEALETIRLRYREEQAAASAQPLGTIRCANHGGRRDGLREAGDLILTALSVCPAPPKVEAPGLREAGDLARLRRTSMDRQEAWKVGGDTAAVGGLFRAVELGGEAGEVLNVVKKLEREARGWRGSRATVEALKEELGDVVICADLLAAEYCIDLWAAVVAKFNATSEKIGLPHRLSASPPGSPVSDLAGETLPDRDGLDGTARLCRALYGRKEQAGDYLGGSDARMLHDAADRIIGAGVPAPGAGEGTSAAGVPPLVALSDRAFDLGVQLSQLDPGARGGVLRMLKNRMNDGALVAAGQTGAAAH